MQGVRLGRDQLIAQFGISGRLAVRVGALMAKRVFLTETVLDAAGPGSPLESLLLQPALLAQADTLSTDSLQRLAEAADRPTEPLAVVEQEGERIIALEEERLAEEGFAAGAARSAEEPAAGGALVRPAHAPVPLLGEREARQMFTPAEVARMKLDALTGADPSARISAIRRLRYAPLSAQEKGGVFLQVLLDPVTPVRSEALDALEDLGFDRDSADALREVFGGQEPERNVALRRLGALIERIGDSEKHVLLTIVLEALREFPSVETQRLIVQILADAAAHIAARRTLLQEVVKAAVNRLLMAPGELMRAVRRLMRRLGEAAPEAVTEDLWQELATLRDPNLRAVLLDFIASSPLPEERRDALARLLLEEMDQPGLTELNRQQVGQALARMGSAGVARLVAAFAEAPSRKKLLLIPLIDMACLDFPSDQAVRKAAAAALAEAMRTSDHIVRTAAASARLLRDPSVPEDLRQGVARLLVRDLGRPTHPDTVNVLCDTLVSYGGAAVQPLMDLLRDEADTPAADRAARVLARIVSAGAPIPDAAETVRRALRLLEARAKDPNATPAVLWALGVIASSEHADESCAHAVARMLRQRLGRAAYRADLLDALGALAAGPHAPASDRVAAAHIFAHLLTRHESEADEILRSSETPDGPVYEFGAQADFDAVTLPVVVQAVRRMCLSEHVSDALRRQLIGRAVEVWEKIARWDVVWGPKSSEALAAALGAAARWEGTAPRERLRIARALARDVRRLSVVRALAALSEAADDNRDLAALLVDAAEAMLAHWMDPDIAPDERETVLRNVATIVARPGLPRSPRVRRLRRTVGTRLLDALREGAYWARDPLERLRDAPATPRDLRGEIETTLRDAFAPARLEQ